jgi:MFS family permease
VSDTSLSTAPSVAPSLTSPERRAVAGLALIASVRMLGLFMLLPVLALYADSLVGATPFLIGVSVGAYGITQALLQIPFGLASDRFGRRPVLILGFLVFAAGGAIAAWSDHIGWVIAGRSVQGAGAVSAVLNALLADLTRKVVRTRAQAIFGASIGLSFMLSLMLGPVLAARMGVDGLFALTCAMALIAAAAIVIKVPALPPMPRTASAHWSTVLKDPALFGLYVGIFALHLVIAAAFVALPFVLRDRLGIEPAAHWQMYLGSVTLSILTTVLLIRGIERSATPGRYVLVAIASLGLAPLGVIVGGETATMVFAALVLLFTGINFLEARLPAEVTLIAGADRRGAALGAYATAQFLGVFAGGATAGALLAAGGANGVFVFASVMTLCWFGLRLLQNPRSEHQ